MMTQSK